MENYEIDRSISGYMLTYMNGDISKHITKIFNTLNGINNLPDLEKTIDLSYIESIIVSIITTEDDIVANMNFDIRNTIIENVADYLQELGIIIKRNEILYSQLVDLLEAVYTIYTLDADNMLYVTTMLDMSSDDMDKDTLLTFCNFISEYTTMSTLDVYEILEDVTSDIIVNLVEYYKVRLEERTKELNKVIEAPLKKLLNVENLISETYYYKSIMIDGYVENTLEDNVDTLYNNINKHGDNLAMIAPEIFITLYLTTDTTDDIVMSFDNRLDLTLTDFSSDSSKISVIRDLLVGYVSKIRSGV